MSAPDEADLRAEIDFLRRLNPRLQARITEARRRPPPQPRMLRIERAFWRFVLALLWAVGVVCVCATVALLAAAVR